MSQQAAAIATRPLVHRSGNFEQTEQFHNSSCPGTQLRTTLRNFQRQMSNLSFVSDLFTKSLSSAEINRVSKSNNKNVFIDILFLELNTAVSRLILLLLTNQLNQRNKDIE